MIYLFGWLFLFFRDVLLPAFAALGAWLAMVFLVWLSTRNRAALKWMLAASIVPMIVTGAMRYPRLNERFNHTERWMFKEFVATPIPAAVKQLSPMSGAPSMFNNGANIKFETDENTLRSLLDHSISGARFPAQLEKITGKNGTILKQFCDEPGHRYRRTLQDDAIVIPKEFGLAKAAAKSLAHKPGAELYVLCLQSESWSLQSLVAWWPQTGAVEISQSLLHVAPPHR